MKLNSRIFMVLVAASAWGAVVAGMALQTLLNLSPCPLCIFQRLLMMVIGVTALLGAIVPRSAGVARWSIVGLSLTGVAVAAYQSWMQVFPETVAACGYADPSLIERLVDYLGMLYPAVFYGYPDSPVDDRG